MSFCALVLEVFLVERKVAVFAIFARVRLRIIDSFIFFVLSALILEKFLNFDFSFHYVLKLESLVHQLSVTLYLKCPSIRGSHTVFPSFSNIFKPIFST